MEKIKAILHYTPLSRFMNSLEEDETASPKDEPNIPEKYEISNSNKK